MPQTSNYLAFDLGAESGRAILGRLDGTTLQLSTLCRFANGPVRVLDGLYWDALRLFQEIKDGLSLYRREHGGQLDGIGLDTWGVDFALLGRDDQLLGNPRHYRDPRTEGMLAAAFEAVPREEIFGQTGIQFMEINSLYQLLAMRRQGDAALDAAHTFLMMPDLLNFWLTGIKACEFSDATTTQCFNPRTGDWAWDLLKRLDLPTRIFQPVVQPGTVIGPLHAGLAEEVGLGATPVMVPACHDTGSAVAAVPAEGQDFAYISSGTWSLMGVEVAEPVITADSLAFNFTNEGGVCGTYRLLKNIMGLWLVQECRRIWAAEGQEYSYDELTQMAAEAPAFGPLVDPDAHEFLRPGDMPARISEFCRASGQRVPASRGEVLRTALESLALKYRWVLQRLEVMLGRRLNTIHIVGGGSQNRLLCQLAADATNRPVVAGPVEATAAGNVLMQALGRGRLGSLADAREVVRRSFDVVRYEPRASDRWDEAYARFLAVGREG
jgi:rhamnulokinase